MSCDLRVIYDVTGNAKILVTTIVQPTLSYVLVNINALYSTSNVALFTADYKSIPSCA